MLWLSVNTLEVTGWKSCRFWWVWNSRAPLGTTWIKISAPLQRSFLEDVIWIATHVTSWLTRLKPKPWKINSLHCARVYNCPLDKKSHLWPTHEIHDVHARLCKCGFISLSVTSAAQQPSVFHCFHRWKVYFNTLIKFYFDSTWTILFLVTFYFYSLHFYTNI